MLVWRLALGRYPGLDGEAARLYGGRWNSPGTAMVYAATHLALAVLEHLVHLSPARLPADIWAFAITLPAAIETEHVAADLALHDSDTTRRAGDFWAASLRSAALIVPSVIVPPALDPGRIATAERNVLLNPRHPSAAAWLSVVTSFRLDPRLRHGAAARGQQT